MDRRDFLAGAGGAALNTVLPGGSDRGPTPNRPRLGLDVVADLRQGLTSLYGLDDRFGGATVGPLATAHLARIERLLSIGDYPESIGRQLRLVAGETAEHVGWLAFDAGRHQQAERYLGQALIRAEELRDDSLAVLVLASMSLVNIQSREPEKALIYTRRAQDQARRWAPPSLLSILATREARALAVLGDAGAARKTLAHAAHLYERDQGSRPAPSWTSFHGPAEIATAQAHLFSAAGHHGAAVVWLRRSLHSQESTYARNEALARARLAAALARSGGTEEALYQVNEAEALLTEVSSGRVRHAVAETRAQLGALGDGHFADRS